MNNLKKSIMGKYNAADVDRLLLKVRNDYELCLKEQKERIISLRNENRELAQTLAGFRSNEQYIIGAITRAEETAQAILNQAKVQADEILEQAKREQQQIKTAVEGCYEKLQRLRITSEDIYRAVTKAVGEQEELGRGVNNVRPFISLYESSNV